MRKLIATVFNYSLDGLLADEGTEFWKFCFDMPEIREPDDPAHLDFLQGAYAPQAGRFGQADLLRQQRIGDAGVLLQQAQDGVIVAV